MMLLTRHRLFFDSGWLSTIATRSPSAHLPFASCAMRRRRCLVRLPYIGCSTRRSTWTTTVLVILAETTVPSRRLIRSRIACFRLRLGLAFFLAKHGHQPRQLAARLLVTARIFELIGAQLETEAEQLLA